MAVTHEIDTEHQLQIELSPEAQLSPELMHSLGELATHPEAHDEAEKPMHERLVAGLDALEALESETKTYNWYHGTAPRKGSIRSKVLKERFRGNVTEMEFERKRALKETVPALRRKAMAAYGVMSGIPTVLQNDVVSVVHEEQEDALETGYALFRLRYGHKRNQQVRQDLIEELSNHLSLTP
jgi:hypothetical protein